MFSVFPHAIAVMGDLCGPKIRIGVIQPEGTILSEGQTVLITDDPSDTAPDRFCTNTPQVISDVCVGHRTPCGRQTTRPASLQGHPQ